MCTPFHPDWYGALNLCEERGACQRVDLCSLGDTCAGEHGATPVRQNLCLCPWFWDVWGKRNQIALMQNVCAILDLVCIE